MIISSSKMPLTLSLISELQILWQVRCGHYFSSKRKFYRVVTDLLASSLWVCRYAILLYKQVLKKVCKILSLSRNKLKQHNFRQFLQVLRFRPAFRRQKLLSRPQRKCKCLLKKKTTVFFVLKSHVKLAISDRHEDQWSLLTIQGQSAFPMSPVTLQQVGTFVQKYKPFSLSKIAFVNNGKHPKKLLIQVSSGTIIT